MKVTETSFSFISEEGSASKAKIPDTQIHKGEPSENFGHNAYVNACAFCESVTSKTAPVFT